MNYRLDTIIPPKLNIGDKIAIVSSARKINIEEIFFAKKLYESWGLEVVLGKTIGAEDNQFAGDDTLRAKDLQIFINDDNTKAIFFARGGYGSVRILDLVDFSSLRNNPKWLVGYSDVTAILMHIYYNVGIASLHGIMPVNIATLEHSAAVDTLYNVLFNGNAEISSPYNPMNRQGVAEGELIGGNLSVLYSLLDSNSFGDTKDKILFIEDLDEYLYHIDRMMYAMKRAKKLDGLRALIVGSFSDMHDNIIPFGHSAAEIIRNAVKDYTFPLLFDIPIGHIGEKNHSIIIGAKTRVICEKNRSATIEQNF